VHKIILSLIVESAVVLLIKNQNYYYKFNLALSGFGIYFYNLVFFWSKFQNLNVAFSGVGIFRLSHFSGSARYSKLPSTLSLLVSWVILHWEVLMEIFY
jgi:hypothetical protein